MTCNLLTDSLYSWGKSAFRKRAKAILAMFDEEQPDIVGGQEYTVRMKYRLSPLLEKYGFTGEPRSIRFSEYTPVLWRKDRFDRIESDTLWLSDTPEVPGSRHFGSQFPRIVTYAVLKDKNTGHLLTVFNTHLDLNFPSVRLKQIHTLLSLIREKGQGHIILTGDFNETSRGKGIQELRTVMHDAVPDSFGSSLRGKAGSTTNHNLPVDHIFHSGGLQWKKTKMIRRKFGDIAPSDHYPVVCELIELQK